MQSTVKQEVEFFWRSQDGATSIEYALIASLVAVVIVGSLLLINGSMTNMYDEIRGAIVPVVTKAQGPNS